MRLLTGPQIAQVSPSVVQTLKELFKTINIVG